VDRSYAAFYRHLYERHWWWRARERVILDRVARLHPPGGFGPILDVGCGDGLLLDKLAAFGEPEGIEADASLVTEEGRRRGCVHVTPFDETFRPGRRYGLVLMLDVIEHFRDDRACLRCALELLGPGGVVVITVPAFPTLWTAHDELSRHFTRYTKRSFARLAADAGLRIDEWRYLFQWTCALKLALRLKDRLRPAPPVLPTIPRPWANRILYACARLEEATYGRLPLPFGSSLLVVGGRSGAG
jgi:SAM-dependent methyltransferase